MTLAVAPHNGKLVMTEALFTLWNNSLEQGCVGRELSMGGHTLYEVEYNAFTVRTLNNLGVKSLLTPLAGSYAYPGPMTPFKHQRTTADFMARHSRMICLNDPGTGKTASAIWASDYLLNEGLIKRVLIICPLSCVEDVWGRELFKLVTRRKMITLVGDTRVRKKVLANSTFEYAIINHDGIRFMADELVAVNFDLVILDEATAVKSEGADRTKAFKELIKGKSYWLLTGTPMSQSPIDAYMLCKLINPDAPQSKSRFAMETMYQINRFKSIARKDAPAVVDKYLTPAIRFSKSECLDMPPVTVIDRFVTPTKEQFEAMKALRIDWAYKAKSGEVVTAVHVASRINKIMQIMQGSVIYDSESGAVVQLDVSSRLNTTIDVIEESLSKTIVFATYTAAVKNLVSKLSAYNPALVYGDCSPTERDLAFKKFRDDDTCRVLVAHPKTTSHGLTLTSASTTIWFGPYASNEAFTQANERMNRPGQVHEMRVVKLYGCREEELVYKSASAAEDQQGLLLQMKELVS